MTRPTLAAASVFLPFFRPSRTSACKVLAEAQHRQARHVEVADVRAGRLGAAQAGNLLVHRLVPLKLKAGISLKSPHRDVRAPAEGYALRLLGFLADDVLAGVLHALALVGLRRTERADLRGDFADALLVGTRDQDLGLRRRRDGDAFRSLEQHRVRETEREAQVLALHGGTVTDADQLELALEAFGHALDHVGH